MASQWAVQNFYDVLRGGNPTPTEALARYLEEDGEFSSAIANGEPPEDTLKEMADVMFTLYGYAIARGWNLDGAFDAVAESNMTKQRTEVGKIQKGPNYVPPDLRRFVLRGAS